MAFDTPHLNDPTTAGPGEIHSNWHMIRTATDFQSGLHAGRFARIDNAGSLVPFDGTASPVPAGVVLRDPAGPVEYDAEYRDELYSQLQYARMGLITVRARDGEDPSLFDRVYISNDGDDNDGMATVDATDVDANAEFIHELQTGVWLIFVTPAPGDVSAHINDSDDAHASTAISYSGTNTSETDVGGVLDETLIDTAVEIADPGDTGSLENSRSAMVPITTGGAETRSLPDPTAAGITLTVSFDSDGGDCTITAATAINQTGNNTITLADAGDFIRLASVQVGGALVWRVVGEDGTALSTV